MAIQYLLGLCLRVAQTRLGGMESVFWDFLKKSTKFQLTISIVNQRLIKKSRNKNVTI